MPVPQTDVVDVCGSAGLSLIASLGSQLGSLSAVRSKSAAGGLSFDNHRIARLTESLAVLELLSELDPTLTLEEGNRLLLNASSVASQTHEATLGSIRAAQRPVVRPHRD